MPFPHMRHFCPEQSLVIEVHGGRHNVPERWLDARGYRVLSFWNDDVLGNLAGVLETIRRAVRV